MEGTVRSRSLRSEEGDAEDEKGKTMRHQPRKMSGIITQLHTFKICARTRTRVGIHGEA